MRKGDARSIEVGVRVLVHKADLNGYRAPAKLEVAGKQEMTGKGGARDWHQHEYHRQDACPSPPAAIWAKKP